MTSASPLKKAAPWLLLPTTVAAVCVFFFRQLETGFAVTFGDRYDGFIELAIMGHWRNVLRGIDAWNATGYFHPYADTLGYNDGYLVYGVLYALFRALSFDAFVAGELAHMTIKAVGVVGMYVLLRRTVRCDVAWSLLGAFVFTIANGNLLQASHGQLFTVAFAPLAAFFLFETVRAIRAGARRDIVVWGLAFGGLYGLWLITAYYMAWYFGFLTVAVVIVALLDSRKAGVSAALAFARTNALPLAIVAAGGLLALAPFLLVYLPKVRETGGHAWMSSLYFALHFFDPINVGDDNMLWGGLFGWLHRTFQPREDYGGEFRTGITPIVLAAFIAQVVVVARERRAPGRRTWLWIAIAVIVTWLMAFNYGKRSAFSPWEVIFRAFPGAKGTRVIVRYQLFLMVPVTVFAIRWLNDQAARGRRWAALAGLVFVVEQLNFTSPARIQVPVERAMLSGVPPIPRDCKSFYVVTARASDYPREDDDLIYAHNVDAMLLASELGVPTINGFSTFNPPDWKLKDAAAADYRERVDRYLRAHELENVCYLDLAHTPGWQRH